MFRKKNNVLSPILGLRQFLGRGVRHPLPRGHTATVPALRLEAEGRAAATAAAAAPAAAADIHPPFGVLSVCHRLSELCLEFSHLLLRKNRGGVISACGAFVLRVRPRGKDFQRWPTEVEHSFAPYPTQLSAAIRDGWVSRDAKDRERLFFRLEDSTPKVRMYIEGSSLAHRRAAGGRLCRQKREP